MAFETSLKINVDSREATQGLTKLNAGLTKTGQKAQQTEGSFQKLKKSMFSLKGAFAALGIGLLARDFIKVSASFEQLRIQLKTVTGSVAQAASEFERIKGLAVSTPFSVQNLTKAFIRLKSIGIQPTSELLTSFGDVAAGLGRDITDFTRAAVGAAFGETEALKSFGIAAKAQGDQIRFTFKGVTTEVDRDVNSIIEALRKIGAENFMGAANDQVNSFNGAVSNLGDSWEALLDNLNQSTGTTDSMADGIRKVANAFNYLATDGIKIAQQNAGFFKNVMTEVLKVLGVAAVLSLGLAFIKFARALTLARIATVAFTIAQNATKAGMIVMAVIIANITGAFDELEAAFNLAAKQAKELIGPAWDTLIGSMKDMGLNLDVLEDEMAGFVAETDVVSLGVAKLSQVVIDAAAALKKEMRTALEVYSDRMEELNELLATGAILQETYDRAVTKTKEALIESDPVYSRVESGMHKFSDAMTDAALESKSFSETMKDTFRSLATDILKELNRIWISKALQGLIGGGSSSGGSIFGQIFSGIAGSFGGGNGLNSGAGFFGFGASQAGADLAGGVSLVTPFAKGGVVNGPTLFPMADGAGLMGEAGPEAVMPLKRGKDGKLGVSGGGGGGVTINMDLRGSNGDDSIVAAVEAGIRRAAPQLIGAAVNKVQDGRSRDPNFFGIGATA
jgi:hypothetical protein